MTIITKPFSEKKSDKLEVPLVVDDKSAEPSAPLSDVEAQTPENVRVLIVPTRIRRVPTPATLCLLITALLVVGIGILGGIYLYQQYSPTQLRFKGWCTIPYPDGTKSAMFIGPNNDHFQMIDDDLIKVDSNSLKNVDSYLQEELELDLENQLYEKISVPNFQNGRNGRFIHDFGSNTTSIVDVTGKRCFVMPLNRNVVLPPRSFYDLILKMWDGYYKINTEVIRETMRVIVPPLNKDEIKLLGTYITRECKGLPIYKLKKYANDIVKRSAEFENNIKFTQFAGNQILEFDIANIEDVKQYEESD